MLHLERKFPPRPALKLEAHVAAAVIQKNMSLAIIPKRDKPAVTATSPASVRSVQSRSDLQAHRLRVKEVSFFFLIINGFVVKLLFVDLNSCKLYAYVTEDKPILHYEGKSS
jgi:hypothetical protein